MLEQQRKQEILMRIRKSGFVSTAELMEQLHTSRSSIMRDLCTLESEGLLVRTRGGASSRVISFHEEASVQEKERLQAAEKEIIARTAAAEVQRSESIYIDTGSTVSYLLPYLAGKAVTVITPSVHLIRHLPANFDGTVYLLGGRYEPKYDMNIGGTAAAAAEAYVYDRAFISANGIRMETGEVMAADPDAAAIKIKVMKRCDRNVLLADSTKFHASAVSVFAKLEAFHAVYTDAGLPEEYRSDLITVAGRENRYENN